MLLPIYHHSSGSISTKDLLHFVLPGYGLRNTHGWTGGDRTGLLVDRSLPPSACAIIDHFLRRIFNRNDLVTTAAAAATIVRVPNRKGAQCSPTSISHLKESSRLSIESFPSRML